MAEPTIEIKTQTEFSSHQVFFFVKFFFTYFLSLSFLQKYHPTITKFRHLAFEPSFFCGITLWSRESVQIIKNVLYRDRLGNPCLYFWDGLKGLKLHFKHLISRSIDLICLSNSTKLIENSFMHKNDLKNCFWFLHSIARRKTP